MAGLGDVTGDDFPDVAIGAPGSTAIPQSGIVRAFSGAPVGVAAYGTEALPG